MKNDRLIGLWLGAVVLMGAAAEVSALTVGRVRGGAVLGQPLQLTVPIQYAADEDISAACFTAEVWYGDFRQDLGRTSVSLDAASGGQSASVRIHSSAPVSEPIVHVNLVAGCRDKVTRRYSVLADAITQPAAPLPATTATAASMQVGVATPNTKESDAAAPVKSLAPVSKAVVKPRVEGKAVAKKDVSKLTLTPAEGKPAAASKAQATAVQAAQVEALEKRVAAVEGWKDQISNPDGMPRVDAKLKTMEADLKGLQVVTAKNQQNVQILTQVVDKMQAERSDNGLIYTFGALLAASVAALGFVMMKVRGSVQQAMPWWRDAAQGTKAAKVSTPAGGPSVAVAEAVHQPAQAALKPQPVATTPTTKHTEAVDSSNVDLDIDIPPHDAGAVASAPQQMTVVPSAPERVDKRDFQPSGSASLRALNTREMLDVRQQAEFFMALGQHDDAIKALESSIHASADSNPLVYLDLLRVLHTLSRKAEFDRYRSEFNHIFTGKVPDYKNFQEEGHGLEAYPEICRQIAELWPSDDAIDYIEQCLVRTPEDGEEDGFDMDAFRDLLMLHGTLHRFSDATDSTIQPFMTSRAPVQVPTDVTTGVSALASSALPNSDLTVGTSTGAPLLGEGGMAGPIVPSASIEVMEPADSQVDLTAAGRDLNLESQTSMPSKPSLDLELDLDIGAEEKPGNLIDFDISVSNYETKKAPSKE